MTRAALGFRAHTGWAAMVAAAGPPSSPTMLQRARVEMIAGHDPAAPPFVYHAASKLPLRAAERLVRESADQARTRAQQAIAAAIGELRERGYEIVATGVIVGNKLVTASLETILGAHPLIHAAEGELFRQAIVAGSETCDLPVTSVRAGELFSRGAKTLRVSEAILRARLAEAGRGAGKPWAQDQKESLLVALLALAGARGDASRA
jgi:hypothetical protein